MFTPVSAELGTVVAGQRDECIRLVQAPPRGRPQVLCQAVPRSLLPDSAWQ